MVNQVNTTKVNTTKNVAKNINFNRVELTGRLVADVENRKLKESERFLITGRVAINRMVKDKKYTEFIEFKMFSNEMLNLEKGQKVYIQGRLTKDTWKAGEENRSKVRVLVFNIVPMIDTRGNDENSVKISGRLVEDPKVFKAKKENRMVLKFKIAVNRNYKVNDEWKKEVTYLEIVSFGTAEYIARVASTLKKGTFVYINGELHNEIVEMEGGKKYEKTYILVKSINVSKANTQQQKQIEQKTENKNKTENKKVAKNEKPRVEEDLDIEIPDDEDVPF